MKSEPGVRMAIWQYYQEAEICQVCTAVCPKVTCLCVPNQRGLLEVSDKALCPSAN